jgi:hypothetical protein
VHNFLNPGGAFGTAIDPRFRDSAWRTLDLPHDWAVELPFVNVDNRDVESHSYKPVNGLFPETSIGWYRKHLLFQVQIQELVFKFNLMEFSEMPISGSMVFCWQ